MPEREPFRNAPDTTLDSPRQSPPSAIARLTRWAFAGFLGLTACKTGPETKPTLDPSSQIDAELAEAATGELEVSYSALTPPTAREIFVGRAMCHDFDDEPAVLEKLEPALECQQTSSVVTAKIKKMLEIEKEYIIFRQTDRSRMNLAEKRKLDVDVDTLIRLLDELEGCVTSPKDMQTMMRIADLEADQIVKRWIMDIVLSSINEDNISVLTEYLNNYESKSKLALIQELNDPQIKLDPDIELKIKALADQAILDMASNSSVEDDHRARVWGVERLAERPGVEVTKKLFYIAQTDHHLEVRYAAIEALAHRDPLLKTVNGRTVDEISQFLIRIIQTPEHPQSDYSLREAAAQTLTLRDGREATLFVLEYFDSFVPGRSGYGEAIAVKQLACREGGPERIVEKKLIEYLEETTKWIVEKPKDTRRRQKIKGWERALSALVRHAEVDPADNEWIREEVIRITDKLTGNNWYIEELKNTAKKTLDQWPAAKSVENRLIDLIETILVILKEDMASTDPDKESYANDIMINIKRSLNYLSQNGQGDWLTPLKALRDEIKDDKDLEEVLVLMDEIIEQQESKAR